MKTYLKCSTCQKIKPTEQFYKKGEGRQSRCKMCGHDQAVKYQRERRLEESRNHLPPATVH